MELGTGSQVVWYFDGIISEYSIPDLSGSTKEGILKALTTNVFSLEERRWISFDQQRDRYML